MKDLMTSSSINISIYSPDITILFLLFVYQYDNP